MTKSLNLSLCLLWTCLATVSMAQENAVKNDFVLFRTHRVYDGLGKKNAYRLLVPEGWKTEGGVTWKNPTEHPNPANLEMKIVDPGSSRQVEFLPNQYFTWGVPVLARGSTYLGQEVQPMVGDIRGFVTQYVLPRYRREKGIKVGNVMAMPEVARDAVKTLDDPTGTVKGIAGRVRIEFVKNGKPIQEDVYVVLFEAKIPGTPMVCWGTERVFTVRSTKGRLDADTGLLLTVANSKRFEQAWYLDYMNALQIVRKGKLAAMEFQRQAQNNIFANQQQTAAIIRAKFDNQNRALDRCHRNFINYIRGVQIYENPHDRSTPITLPSGYANAWATPGGRYAVSNNPNFNPNVGSNLNWRQLTPVR